MPIPLPKCFAAIDFETADRSADSACSVAIVRVEGLEIVGRWHRLIRPPRREFVFTYLHGIAWDHVADEPSFGELWPEFEKQLDGVQFLVAHNAGFDKSVLNECCRQASLARPTVPFKCSMQMARESWNLYPTKLPDVCRHLKIPLVHHQAESDAEASARIALAAMQFEQPVSRSMART